MLVLVVPTAPITVDTDADTDDADSDDADVDTKDVICSPAS